MPAWVQPTVTEFKAFFARDFNFAGADNQADLSLVVDSDVSRAINEASGNFNPAIYGGTTATNAFMYLAAFNLVENIKNSSKGFQAQSNFPISSKSAGPVTVSYAIPERFMKDPYVSSLTANGYGMRYLEMSFPAMTGNVKVVGLNWGRPFGFGPGC